MNKEIIEGNELIAKFDGWWKVGNRFEKRWNYIDRKTNEEHSACHSIKAEEFKYCEDWNLLMPVVEKIERLCGEGFDLSIKKGVKENLCLLSFNHHKILKGAATKIEAVWLSVVEFIKWSNSQPAPSAQ